MILSDKPKMQLEGMDGNIYFILGSASILLKENNMEQEAQEMWDRILDSKSYNEALAIISEYVETELSPEMDAEKRKQGRDER